MSQKSQLQAMRSKIQKKKIIKNVQSNSNLPQNTQNSILPVQSLPQTQPIQKNVIKSIQQPIIAQIQPQMLQEIKVIPSISSPIDIQHYVQNSIIIEKQKHQPSQQIVQEGQISSDNQEKVHNQKVTQNLYLKECQQASHDRLNLNNHNSSVSQDKIQINKISQKNQNSQNPISNQQIQVQHNQVIPGPHNLNKQPNPQIKPYQSLQIPSSKPQSKLIQPPQQKVILKQLTMIKTAISNLSVAYRGLQYIREQCKKDIYYKNRIKDRLKELEHLEIFCQVRKEIKLNQGKAATITQQM